MSSQVSMSPRQELSPRQSGTVEKLMTAGAEELREVGHEALTIRSVAQRARVSPATAYTYLASKNHLFAELFLRSLTEQTATPSRATDPNRRLMVAVHQLTDGLEEFPELAAAVTPALLGNDPNVERLRLRIGAVFLTRFEEALGDAANQEVLDALLFAFSGALLQAGIGVVPYAELGDRVERAFTVIMRGNE